MKAILISIHPEWVELILNFIKKDEIRKGTAIGKAINKLIEEQGVAPTFIYCTKDKKYANLINRGGFLTGMVVARFNATAEEIVTVNRLDTGKVVLYRGHKNGITNRKLMENSCLTFDEMNNYLQGKIGTDIHINDLIIFDKPKEINEYIKWTDKKIEWYTGLPKCRVVRSLTCAPQSYCFIEI